MATPDAVAAHVRFLVVRTQPLVAVDLEGGDTDVPLLLEEGLFRTLVERGLVRLPSFYGVDLPRGARVGFTVTPDEMRLEDEDETRLLRLPRPSVPGEWLERALAMRGTMLLVGRDVGIDPDDAPKQLCDRLEATARTGRLAGAIVGVAEPRTGLPFFSSS